MHQKKAFSLIEVLLVMSIIAVVATMGLSITKRNVEKAYNYYWYTGYSALCDATRDAVMNGRLDIENPSGTLDIYAQWVGNTLMKATTYNYSNNTASFTAPNGISYQIQYMNNNYYKITMTIPKPKQQKAFPNQTVFVYNFGLKTIYPSANVANNATTINLHNRADILPFYLKSTDQKTGTVKTFYGFKDAYCHVKNSITNMGANVNISCSGTPDKPNSIIIPINPRKIY